LSNYYAIPSIAPPTCQVEEQEYNPLPSTKESNIHNEAIQQGVLNGTIPSAVADSGATSSVGTATNPHIATGRTSTKMFHLPDGTCTKATKLKQLIHNVRQPARDVHIVPSITENSLVSTSKFADAGYSTVFMKDKVTIYDTLKRKLVVPREAILRGWRVGDLWQIPLVKMVMNNNTDTVLVDKPPTEFLPE
jgi:hypothetical protein